MPRNNTGHREFLLPDLGEGLTEAEIVTWLVAEGDVIVIDQPVVEVESAKSSVELPSPFAGRIERLHAQPGDIVHKGDVLISVGTIAAVGTVAAAGADGVVGAVGAGEASNLANELVPELVPGTAVRETESELVPELVPGTAVRETESGSGAVLIGYGTKEPAAKVRRMGAGARFGRTSTTPTPTPSQAPAVASDPNPNPNPNPNPTPEPGHSPVISPLVRKQARSHGIDASTLHGTGPGFLVTREDVDAAIAAMEAHVGNDVEGHVGTPTGSMSPAVSPGSNGIGTNGLGGGSGHGGTSGSGGTTRSGEGGGTGSAGGTNDAAADIRTPIAGMRKIIGSRLSHSRSTIPEATIWLDVDATGLFEAKARLEKSTGERFSLTALLARFAVAGLKLYPVLNSSVDDERGEFVQHAGIHLGLAAQTARGLMVPVIRDAGAMTTIQLRDAVADLVTHSQAGDFASGALTGGTFTLNNYGGFGVDGSTPIINHPEVAMLGVGRMIDRPWVVDGQLAVRKVVTLSFVFDHRVCDGDVASGFLTYVAHCVEEPLLLLGTV